MNVTKIKCVDKAVHVPCIKKANNQSLMPSKYKFKGPDCACKNFV